MIKRKLSQFNFELPKELLAERPSYNRDESRLMVINRKTGEFEHKQFKDLVDYFDEGDVMIFNDTKVFPARMYGNKEKTGARIEVFLLRELNKENLLWDVLVDPARKIRIGNKLYFGEDDSLVAEVIDNTTSRGRTLRFLYDGSYHDFRKKLNELGETPLPKYINREPDADDEERYQTIYAKTEGAVAAPTAGLHFSRELLKRLEIKGLEFANLTLHIGLGTFRAVEVEDLSKHKMDSEEVIISDETATIINTGIKEKQRVCAVGTTSMRAIETSVTTQKLMTPFEGWTNKFIYPPYDFSIANCMITNFHTPKSTLLMMVSAFGGHDLIMNAYEEAIKEKYNFFSYGDAMLIL
ncbi:MAG: tRNA preQ1(34) S-adenosylmethionine ribosyltransferase-isomerase QueA [Flavobacteriales bacterium]|nr:tRNA preQ1(34) S-adenosylmethionine ribosyltransferase-isomerase QueA [Flavobacteriales bacterium]|tara:strand:+ start:13305 stop:14363 length:1059 start_codon:yes stop_codon:yes gene_type:complete